MLSEKQLAHSRQVLSKTTIQILIFINIFIFTYHICLNHSKCVNQFLNLPTKKRKKEMSKLLSTPITAPEMPRGSRGTTECLASVFQALVSIFGTTKKQKLKCMSGFFPLPKPQLVKSSDNRNSFADYLRLMLVLIPIAK